METYVLRKDPLLEITILENSFHFKNLSNTVDNGNYEFLEIDSLRIEKRVNWFVSLFSFIFELLSQSGGSDIYKEKDQLKFNYGMHPKQISLKGSDLNLATEVVNKINLQIQAIA